MQTCASNKTLCHAEHTLYTHQLLICTKLDANFAQSLEVGAPNLCIFLQRLSIYCISTEILNLLWNSMCKSRIFPANSMCKQKARCRIMKISCSWGHLLSDWGSKVCRNGAPPRKFRCCQSCFWISPQIIFSLSLGLHCYWPEQRWCHWQGRPARHIRCYG